MHYTSYTLNLKYIKEVFVYCVFMSLVESDSVIQPQHEVVPYDLVVLQGGWLTDQHIDFANNILRNQFRNVQGLETPLLNQSYRGFSCSDTNSPVIQMHNVGNHWVTSFREAAQTEVRLYDSLVSFALPVFQPRLQKLLVKQMKQIYNMGNMNSSIQVLCCSTTIQPNGSDCGVYAIAFATDLCNGRDPGLIDYDTRRMRQHVVTCFSNGVLTSFPAVASRIPVHVTITV